MAVRTPIFLAYLAGLVDGDGSIMIVRRDRRKETYGDRKRGLSFSIIVTIGGETKHLQKLRRETELKSALWVRKKPKLRHLAEWKLAGRYAKTLLIEISPYLRLKHKQAKLALSMPQCRSRWEATPRLRQSQKRCWIEMKNLNHLGRGRRTWHGRRIA